MIIYDFDLLKYINFNLYNIFILENIKEWHIKILYVLKKNIQKTRKISYFGENDDLFFIKRKIKESLYNNEMFIVEKTSLDLKKIINDRLMNEKYRLILIFITDSIEKHLFSLFKKCHVLFIRLNLYGSIFFRKQAFFYFSQYEININIDKIRYLSRIFYNFDFVIDSLKRLQYLNLIKINLYDVIFNNNRILLLKNFDKSKYYFFYFYSLFF